MTKREKIVINAFLSQIQKDALAIDEVVLMMEDTNRYGYLTEEAKNVVYDIYFPQEEKTQEEIEAENDYYLAMADHIRYPSIYPLPTKPSTL